MGVGYEVGIFRKFRVQKSVIIDNWLGCDHGYYYKSIMSLSEKTKKYMEKIQWKFAKTAISTIFTAFSAGKKFFPKNWTRSYFEHCLYASLCKKSEKTKDKISRKCQKTGFSAYFQHFRPEKYFFSKIGLRHILNIIILHQCAKFQEKISSTARDIQEIPFFRWKLAVPAIFRQFRL